MVSGDWRPSDEALSVLCPGTTESVECSSLARALIRWSCAGGAWDQVLATAGVDRFADEHRVTWAIAGAGGSVGPEHGARRVDDAVVTNLAIDRALVAAGTVLSKARVDCMVLKGEATGRLDYATTSDREVGDVDLLVRPADVDYAMRLLVRSGFTRTTTHPFSTSHFFHSETLMDSHGTEIDVHHRFAQASRAPRSIWDDAVGFEVAGCPFRAPSMRWRFVHACVHQMMNPPPSVRRLNGLLDAYRIMSSPGFSLGQAMLAAREIRMEAVVGRCVERMYEVIGEPVPPLPNAERHWSDQWLSRLVDGTDPIPGYASLLTSLANQRWRDWPRYMRELAWPTKAYREEIGRSPLGQLIHIAREAAGR